MSVSADVRSLKSGVQVIVGTSGRVLDMLNRGVITTSLIKMLILDEADELLSSILTTKSIFDLKERTEMQFTISSRNFHRSFRQFFVEQPFQMKQLS